MVLSNLSSVLLYDYKGPKASFTQAHVLKALFVIGEERLIGRGKLGQVLQIGPGEVRTMIKRLKDSGLIKIETGGCTLTWRGLKQFSMLSKLVPWRSTVNGGSLRLGNACFALVVRGRSAKVNKGIEQRDAAIKSGADGALTVLYRKGRFRVPPRAQDCEPTGPSEPWIKIRSADLRDGDVVIVAGSKDELGAEYGALNAALTII